MRKFTLLLVFFTAVTICRAQGVLHVIHQIAPINISVGYVNKDWVTDFGNGNGQYRENLWGEPGKRLHGVQLGVGYAPCMPLGLGMETGLYLEGYFSYSKEVEEQYGYEHYQETNLYIPAHVMFRVPLGLSTAVTVFAGFGVNWTMFGEFGDDEFVYDFWNKSFYNVGENQILLYNGRNGWPKRFNLQSEFGASLKYHSLLFKATYSHGLTDHQFYMTDGQYKTFQNKFAFSVAYVY